MGKWKFLLPGFVLVDDDNRVMKQVGSVHDNNNDDDRDESLFKSGTHSIILPLYS